MIKSVKSIRASIHLSIWRYSYLKWKGEPLANCPSCGSSKIDRCGVRKDSAIVFECVNCGLGFLNPMPITNEIAQFYKDYYNRSDGFGYTSYTEMGDFYWLDYYMLARLKEFGIRSGSRILDIGCANGNKVLFFNKKGFQAKGIDLSEEATTFGRTKFGLDLHRTSIEDYTTQERFDAIIMLDFIEHIRNPNAWAEKVSELLKPNGVVVITTPNFILQQMVGDNWIGFNMSFEHLYFFSPNSIKSLIDRVGMKVEFETSFKSMPISSISTEDVNELSWRHSSLKKLDDLTGNRIKNLSKVLQKARDRAMPGRLAGEVNENHLLFVIARKTR